LVAALAAAPPPILDDQPTKAQLELSTVCGSGKPDDRVQVRVFPITIDRRVFPSPQEIIEKGGSSFMVRAFWKRAMAPICGPNLPDADASPSEFLPRIVVFVEGEEGREPLLVEYPEWGDNPAPVRARVNGKMVVVPAAAVRRLLDFSREGWRD
jgi:hypothetical protein